MKVSQDTRTLKEGEWYIPVKGENFDGHAFIEEAMRKGAAGVVELPELFNLARRKLDKLNPTVIAVTGSYGKTTTKEAIYRVLNSQFPTYRTQGNLNTPLGIAMEVINNLKPRHKFLVAELGMDRLGEIKESCEILQPAVGVVTNIGEMHLEKLGTRENIALAKSELLKALPLKGIAVLNADDPMVVKISKEFAGRKIWFGISWKANVTPRDLGAVKLKLLGSANLLNVLAAVGVGNIFGISKSKVRSALRQLNPYPGRLFLTNGRNGIKVIDDTYNAGPRSMEEALEVLKNFPAERRIAILGDMLELGSAQDNAHRDISRLAAKAADIFVPIGERMAKGAAKAAVGVCSLDDLKLLPGDVVLVKGSRAMRMERIVKKVRRGLLDATYG